MSALVLYEVGGRRYPLVASARCKTCQSPHRRTVEVAVIHGASPTAAVAQLPSDAGLSARNVAEHLRRQHLPVNVEATQRLIEKIGSEPAALVEEGVTRKLAVLALAQTTVEDVTEKIARGEVTPTITEGIRMAKLLADEDAALRAEHRLEEQLRQSHEALRGYLALVKAAVPDDLWARLLDQAYADDALRPYIPRPARSS